MSCVSSYTVQIITIIATYQAWLIDTDLNMLYCDVLIYVT